MLREKGTERAFTGEYWNNHAKGTYVCAALRPDALQLRHQVRVGHGLAELLEPVAKASVEDATRTTACSCRAPRCVCARCGGHLGHVFDDGPRPTGLRYCMNSAALRFIPEK